MNFKAMERNARQTIERIKNTKAKNPDEASRMALDLIDAERALWVVETVKTFTVEEIELLASLRTPAFRVGNKLPAKKIKAKYGFTWSEIENIILYIEGREQKTIHERWEQDSITITPPKAGEDHE